MRQGGNQREGGLHLPVQVAGLVRGVLGNAWQDGAAGAQLDQRGGAAQAEFRGTGIRRPAERGRRIGQRGRCEPAGVLWVGGPDFQRARLAPAQLRAFRR